MRDVVKILRWTIGNRIEAKWLPWYKVLICRIFNIEMPPVKWWIEVVITVMNDDLREGEVLAIPNFGKWYVLEQQYKFFIITTMEPITDHSPEYIGDVVRLGQHKIDN